jgi:hypothetical protein
MAVVSRTYSAEQEVRGVVDALMAAGVPGGSIQVLMAEPERDARAEPHGSFAEAPGERGVGDEPVSDFAGHEHPRSAARGSFAGDADAQRGGSFADADRDTVVSYPEGVARRHVAGDHELRRLLLDAGMDKKAADHDVEAVHEGWILVVADLGDRTGAQAAAAFGE